MRGISLLCSNKVWVYFKVCEFHFGFRVFVRVTILNTAPPSPISASASSTFYICLLVLFCSVLDRQDSSLSRFLFEVHSCSAWSPLCTRSNIPGYQEGICLHMSLVENRKKKLFTLHQSITHSSLPHIIEMTYFIHKN